MSYQIEATAEAKYICAYRCHCCGASNISDGSVSEKATKVTTFRPSLEVHNSLRKEAMAKAESSCKNLKTRVNQLQEFDLLQAGQACCKCGTLPPWKTTGERRHPENAFLVLAGVCFAGTLVGVFAELAWWFPCGCLALTVLSIYLCVQLAGKLHRESCAAQNQKIREILSQSSQGKCFPHVITKDDNITPGELLQILQTEAPTQQEV